LYKIMVGVDGSIYAEHALDVAIEIAKLYNSRLIIVTVYSQLHYLGYITSLKPDIPKDVVQTLNTMLSKYKERAKGAGVEEVETELLSIYKNLMSVGAMLVLEAEKIGCDAIVVGTRGFTGVKRTLLGSVADYVLKNAHCDVHIVRR
jgi:nucleotide-binding universal stress UspA family protein